MQVSRLLQKQQKTGIAGTLSTVASKTFETKLHTIDPDFKVISKACPLFVPLVENGFVAPDNEITRLTVEHYLGCMREECADTVVMGCTHYPIIAPSIQKVLPDAQLINVGAAAAKELREIIAARRSFDPKHIGKVEYYVSDEPQGFETTASVFLGEEIHENVTRIDIEKY